MNLKKIMNLQFAIKKAENPWLTSHCNEKNKGNREPIEGLWVVLKTVLNFICWKMFPISVEECVLP